MVSLGRIEICRHFQAIGVRPPTGRFFAGLVFGALFRVMGLLFATPLTVVGYVAITDLYVREALGEDVAVPGEKDVAPAHAS